MSGKPGITAVLDAPFFTGSAAAQIVPGEFPVALNGRGYILDLQTNEFKHESIPVARNQYMTTSKPGEGAISLEDLWQRNEETWYLGAGQPYRDHTESSDFRFNASKGVNPWTKYQLTLLNDTQKALSSANTNLYMVVAGGYLYVTDGQVLKYTQDMTTGPPATWTSVTGNPGASATSICSDGNNVYVAYGTSGLYQSTRGGASQSQYVTSNVNVCRYVKGRLMTAYSNSIYNITASGALPSPLFTHANSDFTWVDFTDGPDFIYAAGYSGDKSVIYMTAIKTDGSMLDAPIIAGELPSGEIVRSIKGYVGAILIGSDLGWRKCSISASGALSIGPLVTTSSPVYCFEGQASYVFFGWTNYDSTSTGIGRMDLSNEVFPDQPAYATDLMSASGSTTQGTVQSVKTFQTRQVFTVSGVGVFAQAANLVPSGTLNSGMYTYGIWYLKTAIKVELEFASLIGSVGVGIAADGSSTFTSLGTASSAGSTVATFMANQLQARRHELQYTLTRSSGATTTGPTLYRGNLFSDPAAALNQILTVPLQFSKHYKSAAGQNRTMDPRYELTIIEALRSSRQVVTFQEGSTAYTVVVKDFHWVPYATGDNKDGSFDGVCIVELKTIG